MLVSLVLSTRPASPPTHTAQAIVQRSAGLQAWLARHRQQLRGLRCDLPTNIHQPYRSWEEERAGALRAVLPAIATVLWEHRTAMASLLLSGDKLQAALAAAGGDAEPDSGLAQCTALQALTIWEYAGTAEALAALVAALSSLSRLELAWGAPTPGGLLRAAPPAPLPSVLQAMVLCRDFFVPFFNPDWDVAGLVACTALTRLDAAFGGQGIEEGSEQCLAQLRQERGSTASCLTG